MSQPALPADQVRQLLTTYRRGEEARSRLTAALDAHAVYSELPDPPPVFLVIRGELVEVKPVSLYGRPAPTPAPPPVPAPVPAPSPAVKPVPSGTPGGTKP